MDKTTRFDAADYLTTPEAQAEFISAALETGNEMNIAGVGGMVRNPLLGAAVTDAPWR